MFQFFLLPYLTSFLILLLFLFLLFVSAGFNFFPFLVYCLVYKRFNNIPITAAKLIPEIVSEKSPFTIDIAAPPKPNTNIVEATTTFLGSSKSICF